MPNSSGSGSGLMDYASVPNLKNLFHYDFAYILTAYGVIPISMIVLISNSLLLFLFWKKRLRSSIHIFVAAISISETVFILIQVIFSIYFLHVLNITSYIPYQHCVMFTLTFHILPEIFRCHSIFLTVALATQRCVSVTHPLTISRVFTRKRSILIVVGLFLLSVIFKMYDLIFLEMKEGRNSTCIVLPSGWTRDYFENLFYTQAILWISCVNVVPCVWLIVTGSIMICGLRKASNWRRTAAVFRMKQHIVQDAKERKLTIITVWIIGIFLFFQTPYYVIDSLTAYPRIFVQSKGANIVLLGARNLTQFCVNVTLPSNFIIYIVCYKEYYEYLKSVFVCGRSAVDLNQLDKSIT